MAKQGEHGIGWTDETWNPIRGCSRVSEGCRNCYAERVAARFSDEGQPYHGLAQRLRSTKYENGLPIRGTAPRWTGEVRFIEEHLADPMKWRKPKRVFVNSMSDLFHEKVQDEWIDRIFAVMALCPQHTFQVLTKRPERMREYLSLDVRSHSIRDAILAWHEAGSSSNGLSHFKQCERLPDYPLKVAYELDDRLTHPRWPLPNVWLGVSCEDQPTADERIPLLLETPAAVRFISYEPALAPVDLTRLDYRNLLRHHLEGFMKFDGETPEAAKAKAAMEVPSGNLGDEAPALNALTGEWFDGWDSGESERKIDWVIIGGESGPGSRPFDVRWARDVIAQCKSAGTACFVKQLGSARPQGFSRFLNDRKGADWKEWPEDLRVREYPEVR